MPSNPDKDYYYIHIDTGVTEPVIVEYGFLTNSSDLDRVQNNYKNYVEAVVRAVMEYKNLPYTPIGGSTPSPDTGNIYIVVIGDSLWKISNQFGITVDRLRSANNLTNDLLTVGQQLIILV